MSVEQAPPEIQKSDLTPHFDGKAQMLDSPAPGFTLERVTTAESLEQEWEPLLVEIFPDENDREPIELLQERLDSGENFFLLRDDEGTPVGIELSQVLLDGPPTDLSPDSPRAMYIPWTGVVQEHRNVGIGSEMNREISRYMSNAYGVTHTLIDIEDPDRLHNSAYEPEEMDEAIGFAHRRINFWRREGFDVVDDGNAASGEKLEYMRPASDDEQKIQAYDHMAVRIEDDALAARVYNEEGTAIDKGFVRDCYLEMTQIQYGYESEEKLREMYPAVDQYLEDLDNTPGQWLAIRTEAVRPKSTPDITQEHDDSADFG